MPQSFARVVIHTTFSTKYRLPLIAPEIERALYAVLRKSLENQGAQVMRIGGVPDHVHIVHTIPRTVSIAKMMQVTKSASSSWLRRQGRLFKSFGWQDGYACFSVDYRKMNGLIRYIDRQKEHHGLAGNALSYEEEYLKLLKAYGFTDYNETYLFPNPPDDDLCSEPRLPYGTSQPRGGVSLSVG